MRCLLASILLLLCCSISYGQTSVLIDVPPILPVPITDCDCVDCTCALEPVVSVEVERTGILARLCARRGGERERGPRFLLKIFTRNRPEVGVEVEGVVVPPAPVRGEI